MSSLPHYLITSLSCAALVAKLPAVHLPLDYKAVISGIPPECHSACVIQVSADIFREKLKALVRTSTEKNIISGKGSHTCSKVLPTTN